MSASRLAPRAPLAVSLLGLSLCAISSAQAQDAQRVVVTATREPLALDRVASDVVLINAQTLRDSTADSLEDLLRREAGLQVSRSGGPGQGAGVFIRGANSGHTLVLIDGVRVGSATLGYAGLEALDLSQIERIEVLRGPASSLYGADAIGGVVQIITRKGPGGWRFGAHAALGEYGSGQADANVSGSLGGFDLAASLGHERSDGVSALRPGDAFGNHNPDDDGFRRTSATLRAGFTPMQGHRVGVSLFESRLNAQYDASEYAPPDFLPDASPDFRNHLDTRVAALDYRGTLTSAWTTSVQLARNEDELRSGGSTDSRYDTRRDQFTWQNAWAFAPGQQLLLALERLEERAETGDYLSTARRDNDALVLGYSGRFGAHSLQADLRHDDNSVHGDVDTGRLGWTMDLSSEWRVRALAGTTFHAPSFNDLYYPGYGVATLQPERGRSVELGLNWRAGDAEAGATVYRNRVRDLVAYEPDRSVCPADPAYDFGCARNVNRARLQGVTLSAAQRWGGFSLRGEVDFLDATNEDTGDRLARRAAHQGSLTAEQQLGAWTWGASLLGVGARPDGGAQLGAYETLDLRAAWRFAPQWRLEAKLLNATDRDVEPVLDYQGPGRQAWLGLRYDSVGL